jgi:hypothetical protein
MQEAALSQLLDEEVASCAEDEVLSSNGIRVWKVGCNIMVGFERGRDAKPGVFRFGCAYFDAQPPSVAMVDPGTGVELPLERWTPGIPHGLHPVTGKPFVCIQGVAEYHSHPSHLGDSWDRYRHRYRIPQTAKRLLQKSGAIP